MAETRGVVRMPTGDVARAVNRLRGEHWRMYVLASVIQDQAAFFDAVRAVLPLDPPLVSNRSWEALEDSLWEGLRLLSEDRIAIIWPNVCLIEQNQPRACATAIRVLTDIADTIADDAFTLGRPKTLRVVLGDA